MSNKVNLQDVLNTIFGETPILNKNVKTKKPDAVKNSLNTSGNIEKAKGKKCEISTENHPVYKKGTKGEIADVIMGTEQYVVKLENDGIAYVGIKDIDIIEEDKPILLESSQSYTFKLYKNKVLVNKGDVLRDSTFSPLKLNQKSIDFLNSHVIEFPHSVTSILVQQQRSEEAECHIKDINQRIDDAKKYIAAINQQIDESNKEKSNIIKGILGNGGYTYERQ